MKFGLNHLSGVCTQEYESIRWMGHAEMRGTPRLGVSVLMGTRVDERMGSFGLLVMRRGAAIYLRYWVYEGV
jgi:hypothetical protein